LYKRLNDERILRTSVVFGLLGVIERLLGGLLEARFLGDAFLVAAFLAFSSFIMLAHVLPFKLFIGRSGIFIL
jgi:hypothetical protein